MPTIKTKMPAKKAPQAKKIAPIKKPIKVTRQKTVRTAKNPQTAWYHELPSPAAITTPPVLPDTYHLSPDTYSVRPGNVS